ncbi:MAG: uncharacterized protein JWN44_413 [Myxococcales bacterium]|nr:uncharacterized protein [Myxococcales bacterium]
MLPRPYSDPVKRTDSTTTQSLDPSGSSHDSRIGLLLVAGDGGLTTYPLLRDELLIGRAPECDIAIDHTTLSRRHARLRLGPPITLEDLGSKNGTRAGAGLLTPGVAAPLAMGETFHIGRFSFVVVRAGRSRDLSGRSNSAEALRVLDPTVDGASALVRDIAQSGLSALILGETGVGKELLAQTLHHHSGRKGRLVTINCAAIAPALIESELFGHEKGAFTGALHGRPGLLEAAEDGTVFLDEVGELPSQAQAKLLRAIESREVTRVGGVRPITLQVRFVSATNRDLAQAMSESRFRSDLFFRLDGVTLFIPPLRERSEQIETLAVRFIEEARARRGLTGLPRLAPGLLDHLKRYAWPGNVRELKAVTERAVLLARGGEIGSRHVVLAAVSDGADGARATALPAATRAGTSAPPAWTPQEAEDRQRILDALEACSGNQTRAAKHLGISRATLVNRLTLYRIPRPRK